MRLYFDVAAFHKDVEGAEGRTEDEIVEEYVEKLRAGEASDPEVEPRPFDLNVARQWVEALRPATKEVFLKRMATCLACDRATVIASPGIRQRMVQCKECHCLMNAKARFRGMNCPLDRFPADAR